MNLFYVGGQFLAAISAKKHPSRSVRLPPLSAGIPQMARHFSYRYLTQTPLAHQAVKAIDKNGKKLGGAAKTSFSLPDRR